MFILLGHTPHVLPNHLEWDIIAWRLPAKRRPPTAAPARGRRRVPVLAVGWARYERLNIYLDLSSCLEVMSHLSLIVCATIFDCVRSEMLPPALT
jgi:hypothetical protein